MSNPMIMKLEYGAPLSDGDRAKLAEISLASRKVGAREDLIGAGETPRFVHLILDGFACRYKTLADGTRSIVAYLLPGDFCDLHVAILGTMDHSIATISPCTLVQIPRETVLQLTDHYPRITRAMWWATLVDEAVLREWLVNMGCRPADKRLAHLFCELYWRLRMVGFVVTDSFRMPLTQQELGETAGITGVHVNRVIQQLREKGLIKLVNRHITIPDIERLEKFADFDPAYLYLARSFERQKAPASA